MDTATILATLAKLGKPQTATIYKRHLSGDKVFGVLTSDLAKLRKKVTADPALAAELWATGYAEARVLALLLVDPAKVTRVAAERYVKEGPVRFLGCYLAPLLAQSPVAQTLMRDWTKSKDESVREMGYGILSFLLKNDAASVSDADAEKRLKTIEKEIHGSPNWARYAMNGALIAIGVYRPALRKAALAAADRIGDIAVDHGETFCKTPDAVAYIKKASQRKLCP